MTGPRQLELIELCDTCGRLTYGHISGQRTPGHGACSKAVRRWLREDNVDVWGAELDRLEAAQKRAQ